MTIAVWSSILLHTASLLGFELAFSNKRKSFPESEPRTITLLSIETVHESIVATEQESFSSNISPQIIEKFVPDKLVPIENEQPLVQPGEISFPDFISDNVESNNSSSNSDQSINQKVSVGNDIVEDVPKIKEPVPIETITPVYPFRARKKGLEGTVTLEVVISDTGTPLSCLILNSSGFTDLDDTAVKTVFSGIKVSV